MDGLGEKLEVVSLVSGAAHELGGGGLSGEQNDASPGPAVLNFDGHIDSGHVGHKDVGKDDVGATLVDKAQSFFAVVGLVGDEAMFVQDGAESVGDEGLVVDDKDDGFGFF